MRTNDARVERPRGFTLPEMLTVMAVTSLLMGALWHVGVKAVVVANRARVATELRNLSEAVENFAQQFGDYPPDFHDPVAARRFVHAMFPKCPERNYPNLSGQSPATALYFWLAGPKGRGFSANPVNPFDDGPRRIGPFIDLAADRLRPTCSGGVQYLPPGGAGSPYVYFRGGLHGYDGNRGWPPVHPYRFSKDNSWINADTFQIIAPGDDGRFGGGHHYPGGSDYDEANHDDISNFSGGSTLGQAMPAARDAKKTGKDE